MTLICGIDPGLSGAIAFLVPSLRRVAVYDMPVVDGEISAPQFGKLVREWAPTIAIIEDVWNRPHDGGSSAFKFGRATGVAIGVIGALEVPLHKVTPQRWKSQYGLIKKDKDASRKLAIEMFPAIAGDLKLKKHHGRGEAALIALFGADKLFL